MSRSSERSASITSERPTRQRFAAVSTTSRSDQVAEVVRAAILSGELVPGFQLKQDELRAEFGVSPTPIREALRQLESEGLVTHYPNRGAFVASVSGDELLGVLLPVRLILERYAVTKALSEGGADLLEELGHVVTVMQEAAANGERGAVYEADVAFHELLVVSSGAPHTLQLWRAVQPRIRVLMYQLGPRHRTLDEIPAEHLELLEALKRNDPDQLDRVFESHIVWDSARWLKPGEAEARPRRRTTRARRP